MLWNENKTLKVVDLTNRLADIFIDNFCPYLLSILFFCGRKKGAKKKKSEKKNMLHELFISWIYLNFIISIYQIIDFKVSPFALSVLSFLHLFSWRERERTITLLYRRWHFVIHLTNSIGWGPVIKIFQWWGVAPWRWNSLSWL